MSSQVSQNEDVIILEGAVTFETVASIQKSILQLLRNAGSSLEFKVNLQAVTQVNSAALGLLVELKKYIMAHRKIIVFLHSPERLISLAQVCGVADWLGLL